MRGGVGQSAQARERGRGGDGLGQARVGKVLGRVSETGHGKERGRAGLDWFPGPVFILFLSGLRWVWVRVGVWVGWVSFFCSDFPFFFLFAKTN